MSSLYLDTSAFLAVLFGEPKSAEVVPLLRNVEEILSSDLLEAEARAAGARKNLPVEAMDQALDKISLSHPERSLTPEIKTVVSAAPGLRGADVWHLACALSLSGDPSNLPFVTLDGNQAEAALRLGFKVLPESLGRNPTAQEAPALYRAGKPRVARKKRK